MQTLGRNQVLVIAISLTVFLLTVTVYSAGENVLTVATISHSQLFNGPAAVTVRILTLKPGDSLPWHYHPGYAFNSIKSGNLTVEDGCGGVQTLTPGQGFEEAAGRVHRARNLGTTDVVVYNTFITVAGKPTMVEVADNQSRCGPPSTVADCKNDGWRKFTHPRVFANEEQCATSLQSEAQSPFYIQP